MKRALAILVAMSIAGPALADQMFGIPFEVPRSGSNSYYQEQLNSQQQRLDEHIRTEQNRRNNEGLGGTGPYDHY